MANVLFSRTSDPSSKPITDGQLIFDTSGNGKMYLDNGTERLEMGGSMSVDSVLNAESTNPIQNKAVATKFKHQYISAINRVYGYTTEGNVINIDDATPDNCVALVYHDVYTDKVYMIEKIQNSSSVYSPLLFIRAYTVSPWLKFVICVPG